MALIADSADFLEDAAINLTIALALGWPLARRAWAGRAMALVILVPACTAVAAAFRKAGDPDPPDVTLLVLTAGGAALVNLLAAVIVSRVRRHGGSLTAAAFLSARNDVVVNLAIIAMAVVTAVTGSGWPDIVLGLLIVLIALHPAWEVWEIAAEEAR